MLFRKDMRLFSLKAKDALSRPNRPYRMSTLADSDLTFNGAKTQEDSTRTAI